MVIKHRRAGVGLTLSHGHGNPIGDCHDFGDKGPLLVQMLMATLVGVGRKRLADEAGGSQSGKYLGIHSAGVSRSKMWFK